MSAIKRVEISCDCERTEPAMPEHRHYEGFSGAHFHVRSGSECDLCGRAWFALTEMLIGGVCQDCTSSGRSILDGPARIMAPTYKPAKGPS